MSAYRTEPHQSSGRSQQIQQEVSVLVSSFAGSYLEILSPVDPMRRHHFLSLRHTDHPPEIVSLLIDAEAKQRTPTALSPRVEMHKRLRSVSSGTMLGETEHDSNSPASEDGPAGEEGKGPSSPGFLGRVHSYSRLMHAHTKSQLHRPKVGTLPSYTKTMHAFTRDQLNDERQLSGSKTTSPQIGARLAVALNLHAEVSKLVPDDVPPAPGNTPELGSRVELQHSVHRMASPTLKRRSITDPDIVRMAVPAVYARDSAAV